MGHTYSNLLYHVTFSTKERRRTIREAWADRLHQYMAGIARDEFGKALAIGGTEDHVHGLLVLPTTVCIAEAMRKWKSLSSKWVNETLSPAEHFAWQNGYGAFTVSHSNAPQVATYIEGQAEHHKRMTFQEEFIALLERHGIEYDPRYVWD